MNNTATIAFASVLAAGLAFGAYRAGAIGAQYAEVVSATPVTVKEPRYVDVVDVLPVIQTNSGVGYEVQYQLEGRLLTRQMSWKPGDQVRVGDWNRIIGYDVDWRYRDRTGTIRMDRKPGDRLPMVDGAIVESTRPVTPARKG